MELFFGEMAEEMALADIISRLILAVLLGGLMGIEREYKNRPAGLRTHMLVSLGAATFTLIAFELFNLMEQDVHQVNGDIIRLVEAVTAGVAFLAAGTIIQSGRGVLGLTTGAGMWVAGAVGLACGAGLFVIALSATLLALVIMVVLRFFEAIIPSRSTDSDESSSLRKD